jgi:uncharacterized glyoxalase superfamily protein PhnB
VTAPEPAASGSATRFEGATPILRVRNLTFSVSWYAGMLGFKLDWRAENGGMASVSRDRCAIMLCEGDQGSPGTWVWIGVEDAAALHQEYVASGARIRLPPTNYPWAQEMQVTDPDGHVLRFGSEPLHDRPFQDWVTPER